MSGSLSDSPAKIVQYLLEDLSLGMLPSNGQGASDWPIFRGILQNSPDNAILVLDTAGIDLGSFMTSGEQQEMFGVQIMVRAGGTSPYETAYDKAKAIKDVFNDVTSVYRTSVTVGANTYLVQEITTSSGPIDVGKEVESSQRRLFSVNAVVDVRQTA